MNYDKQAEYRRLLLNCLAQMNNILYNIRYDKSPDYDNKIKGLQEIQKVIPNCIRIMLYFKNKGE